MNVVDAGRKALNGDTAEAVALVAALLSYAIVVGSFALKLPQIINIFRYRSVRGLSLEMLVMEIIGYGICASYNYAHHYALATYAENITILVQNLFLVLLLVSYRREINAKFFAGVLLLLLWAALILTRSIPRSVDVFFMTFVNIPLFAASRIPQIRQNYKCKSTGVLAVAGFILAFGGNLARILTTLAGNADPLILAGFCLSGCLNATIIVQCFLYADRPHAGKDDERKAD